MKRARGPTLRDVANTAGVSPAAVSFVLNNTKPIAPLKPQRNQPGRARINLRIERRIIQPHTLGAGDQRIPRRMRPRRRLQRRPNRHAKPRRRAQSLDIAGCHRVTPIFAGV